MTRIERQVSRIFDSNSKEHIATFIPNALSPDTYKGFNQLILKNKWDSTSGRRYENGNKNARSPSSIIGYVE